MPVAVSYIFLFLLLTSTVLKQCSTHSSAGNELPSLYMTELSVNNGGRRGKFCYDLNVVAGYAVAKLVEALHYKPDGRGFDSRCGHLNFSLS